MVPYKITPYINGKQTTAKLTYNNISSTNNTHSPKTSVKFPQLNMYYS